MPRNFEISQRMLSGLFWEKMFANGDELQSERSVLFDRLSTLESLRDRADYNTGSISYAAAWCLYSLVRYFQFNRAIEVGTFIGKSSVSILSAMDAVGSNGTLYTCDGSNDLTIPWQGKAKLNQFPKTTSKEMLSKLEGQFDFLFLDGRLSVEELGLLDKLIAEDTVIALDDFEGFEKGVSNFTLLSQLPKLRSSVLLYPSTERQLREAGLSSHSLTAVMLPSNLISLVKQG